MKKAVRRSFPSKKAVRQTNLAETRILRTRESKHNRHTVDRHEIDIEADSSLTDMEEVKNPAFVETSVSLTKNLTGGNYIKVTVGISRPSLNTDDAIGRTYRSCQRLAAQFIESELEAAEASFEV